MWSAFHLDDGSHTHAVGVPQMPGYGVGYVQRDGELSEIESVHASEEVADNGLITSARVESGPDELALDIEPLAFGALRLEAPRRPPVPVPARHGPGPRRGRPHRDRLDRVEPGAARCRLEALTRTDAPCTIRHSV